MYLLQGISINNNMLPSICYTVIYMVRVEVRVGFNVLSLFTSRYGYKPVVSLVPRTLSEKLKGVWARD